MTESEYTIIPEEEFYEINKAKWAADPPTFLLGSCQYFGIEAALELLQKQFPTSADLLKSLKLEGYDFVIDKEDTVSEVIESHFADEIVEEATDHAKMPDIYTDTPLADLIRDHADEPAYLFTVQFYDIMRNLAYDLWSALFYSPVFLLDEAGNPCYSDVFFHLEEVENEALAVYLMLEFNLIESLEDISGFDT